MIPDTVSKLCEWLLDSITCRVITRGKKVLHAHCQVQFFKHNPHWKVAGPMEAESLDMEGRMLALTATMIPPTLQSITIVIKASA